MHREISDTIRDIDIPLLFAADKILLVMPHTSREGSVVVADRIRARIGALKPPGSMADLRATASLAVASTEGLEEVSFGRLIQEAMRALKEAELKGGDVVMVPAAAGSGELQRPRRCPQVSWVPDFISD